MEHYKISKLSNNLTVSKFLTKEWTEINDLSSSEYSPNKNIRFKNSMLRPDLCDYGDAYIIVEEKITVEGDNYDKKEIKN